MVCLRGRLKHYFVIICSFFLFWINFGCNADQSGTGADKQKRLTLVSKAYNYIGGGPGWFLAPSSCSGVIGVSSGNSKNTSGAVAWTIQVDDLGSFRQKIINSSPTEQTDWNQYTCVGSSNPCGFPFGSCVESNDAGMVCWSLIVNAMKDAGYSFSDPVLSCDYFNTHYPAVTNGFAPGDIVLYDWNKDGSYDHSGIITSTPVSDPKLFFVISVVNIIREFNLGAAEKRLGIFETITDSEGGDSDYNYKIVRPQ